MAGIVEKIESLDRLLERRNEEYPKKGPVWHRIEKESESFLKLLLKELDGDWAPDDSILEKINTFINSPIFVCGPARSGTTLVTQLLDGHPNLFVMPGDSHYMGKFYNKKWKFHSLALYWMKRLINPSGQTPFWFLGKDPENYRIFLLYLRYFLGQKMEPFLAAVSSLFAAQGNINDEVRYWVEKTPENEKHAGVIQNKFPGAKFIHLIRNPLDNLASLKSFSLSRNQDFHLKDAALHLKSLIDLAWLNLGKLGPERYLVLRYEDLVGSLKESLDRICGFLSLTFSESLMIPTVNRIPASSNSSFKERRKIGQVLEQNKAPRRMEHFTEEEVQNIASILSETALRGGYPA